METVSTQKIFARKEAASSTMDQVIHAVCFISVLLIGADIWGLDIGVNLRYDQIFLCILSILLVINQKYRFTWNAWIAVFLGAGLVSTLFAVSFVRGSMFYFSMVYNVVFLYYAFESYVRAYGLRKFISIFRKTMIVQFFILIFQVLLKLGTGHELSFLPSYGEHMGVPRFSLWFYEPSYFVTYLSFWFALSLYMFLIQGRRGYLKDILMSIVMFLLAASTTGFLAIALSCVIVYVIWLLKGFSARKLVFPCVVLLGFLIFRFGFSSIYEVFFARLFNQSLDSASGGRISAWLETWQVFIKNPLFGVGPGNYGIYLGKDAGTVPSNVTLELMATVGIFAAIAFYGLTISLCVRTRRIYCLEKSKNCALLAACVVGLIIFTIILQANQGYLRLYHWMFFGIISGGVHQYQVIVKQKTRLKGQNIK